MPVRPRENGDPSSPTDSDAPRFGGEARLRRSEVERYSRQMLLPEVGPTGTRALLDAHVLIVGAGGLGCPSALYLAAAGVGHLTVVDMDVVDRSNLHRQVGHPDARVGVNKARSLRETCLGINPTIEITAVEEQFGPANGLALVRAADVVLDATDNVAARYMINDACVLAGKPLVSGSAMRWEGQLTVYNYAGGPCYRCVFPQPPPEVTLGNCSDSGVVGAVPGVIGALQALEVQKVLMPAAAAEGGVMAGRMLFWDGLRGSYRALKMRPRQRDCRVCGDADAVPAETRITALQSVGANYEAGACGRVPNDLPAENRVSAATAAEHLLCSSDALLVDVRSREQYAMAALPGAYSVPLALLNAAANPWEALRASLPSEAAERLEPGTDNAAREVLVCCRRGNASVSATKLLLNAPAPRIPVVVRNVDGGLAALTKAGVDFPDY